MISLRLLTQAAGSAAVQMVGGGLSRMAGFGQGRGLRLLVTQGLAQAPALALIQLIFVFLLRTMAMTMMKKEEIPCTRRHHRCCRCRRQMKFHFL